MEDFPKEEAKLFYLRLGDIEVSSSKSFTHGASTIKRLLKNRDIKKYLELYKRKNIPHITDMCG